QADPTAELVAVVRGRPQGAENREGPADPRHGRVSVAERRRAEYRRVGPADGDGAAALRDLAGGHPGRLTLAGRQSATVALHHVDVVELIAVPSDQLGQGVAADLGVDRHRPGRGGCPVERPGSPGLRTRLRSL